MDELARERETCELPAFSYLTINNFFFFFFFFPFLRLFPACVLISFLLFLFIFIFFFAALQLFHYFLIHSIKAKMIYSLVRSLEAPNHSFPIVLLFLFFTYFVCRFIEFLNFSLFRSLAS